MYTIMIGGEDRYGNEYQGCVGVFETYDEAWEAEDKITWEQVRDYIEKEFDAKEVYDVWADVMYIEEVSTFIK